MPALIPELLEELLLDDELLLEEELLDELELDDELLLELLLDELELDVLLLLDEELELLLLDELELDELELDELELEELLLLDEPDNESSGPPQLHNKKIPAMPATDFINFNGMVFCPARDNVGYICSTRIIYSYFK